MELTKEEATAFFAEFYYGEHHIPGYQVYPFGQGWMVKHDRGDIATYDYDGLTRLVLMAHDKAYRVSVMPMNAGKLKICVWKRQRDGGMTESHPAINQAIEKYNLYITNKKQ